MTSDVDPEARQGDDDGFSDAVPLAVVMGSRPGQSLRICVDGDPVQVTAKRDRMYEGSTSRWRRAGVIVGNDDGSKKTYFFLLIEPDPSAEPRAIEFAPFSVHGRFKVRERASDAKAREAFASFKESLIAK